MVTCDVIAQTVTQSLQTIGGHSIVFHHSLGVVPQAVNILFYAVIGRGVASILTIRGHIAVETGTLQYVSERSEIAVVGNKTFDSLSGRGVQVRLVRLLITGNQTHTHGQQT